MAIGQGAMLKDKWPTSPSKLAAPSHGSTHPLTDTVLQIKSDGLGPRNAQRGGGGISTR